MILSNWAALPILVSHHFLNEIKSMHVVKLLMDLCYEQMFSLEVFYFTVTFKRLLKWCEFVFYYCWMQIIDAVVAAHILNAVLVIPKLDKQSYWKDSRFLLDMIYTWMHFIINPFFRLVISFFGSNHSFFCSDFSEIFDVNWFISYLSKDVKIVKDLPRMGNELIIPHTTRVPRKCNAECYQTRIRPILNKKHVSQFNVRITSLSSTCFLYLNMVPLLDRNFCKITCSLSKLMFCFSCWFMCMSWLLWKSIFFFSSRDWCRSKS